MGNTAQNNTGQKNTGLDTQQIVDFPHTSIQRRIVVFIFILSLISFGLFGFIAYKIAFNALVEKQRVILSKNTKENAADFQRTLDLLRNDVLYLAATPPIEGIIQAQRNKGFDPIEGSSEALWRRQLQALFTQMLRVKPEYMQAQFVSAQSPGKELVRVNQTQSNGIDIVADEDLQLASNEPYFAETIKLENGEVYISNLGYNREHESLEIPLNPVLRASTPIFTASGELFGIIVIKLSAKKSIERFQSKGSAHSSSYTLEQSGRPVTLTDQRMAEATSALDQFEQFLLHQRIETTFQRNIHEALTLNFENLLSTLHEDVLFVAENSTMRKFAASRQNDGEASSNAKEANDALTPLAQRLSMLANVRSGYLELSIFKKTASGFERLLEVTGNATNDASSPSHPQAHTESKTSLFENTIRLPQGEAYLSGEFLSLGEPSLSNDDTNPVLQISSPIYADDATVFGLVSLRYTLGPVWDTLKSIDIEPLTELRKTPSTFIRRRNPRRHVSSANNQLGGINEAFPELTKLIWSQIENRSYDQDYLVDTVGPEGREYVVDFSVVPFDPRSKNRFIVLISATSKDYIASGLSFLPRALLVTAALILLISLPLKLVVVRTITNPLQQLYQGIQEFRRTNARPELPINDSGEIGAIAIAFDALIREVRKKTKQLSRQNKDLLRSNQELEEFAYVSS
ncbi:MAG: HAMP domain-containing protein, partial [Bdellovibrionales bacterium]|nr:HAMP domain-containing protein [Bdellovibrionales bacterium]